MGRPTKLNDKTTRIICEAISKGMTKKRSCELAGISPTTFDKWIKRAEEGDEYCQKFAEAMAIADARCELNALECIDDAMMSGVWTAGAWILERRYPQRWAKQERIDVSSQGKNSFKIQIESVESNYEMDDDEKELLSDD